MKKIFILTIIIFSTYNLFAHAKKYSRVKDTVIIVVDTCAKYVEYKDYTITKKDQMYAKTPSAFGKTAFEIYIKGHYYDNTFFANIAGVSLEKIYKGNRYIDINESEIKIRKNNLKKYKQITSEEINIVKTYRELYKRFKSIPSYKSIAHFVIFKSELNNETKDSIIIHRVFVGAGVVVP